MGTMASMSISILVEGVLWGLISCHNKTPRRVPLQTRNACDILTQTFALQLAAKERGALSEQRLKLGAIQARLLAFMAEEENFVEGFLKHPEDVLALTDAGGAAIVTGQRCHLMGRTPTERQVRGVYEWLLAEHAGEAVHATDALGEEYPPARTIADTASGLLAISISEKYASYVLWFRPEVIQTVRWGGDPTKSTSKDPDAARTGCIRASPSRPGRRPCRAAPCPGRCRRSTPPRTCAPRCSASCCAGPRSWRP